jgi:hypothetical protein
MRLALLSPGICSPVFMWCGTALSATGGWIGNLSLVSLSLRSLKTNVDRVDRVGS